MCLFKTVYGVCVLGQRCGQSSTCVRTSQWCDGRTDCPAGEDEARCCKTPFHINQTLNISVSEVQETNAMFTFVQFASTALISCCRVFQVKTKNGS